MKIDKVLFTCNENEEYIGFWNSISKYFKTKINIEPILFFIGNPNKYNLSEKFGNIIVINEIKNIPTRIQALWGKFYFTNIEPNTIWLIGDLDLYHFNKDYFNITEKCNYAHLNENGYFSSSHWTKDKNVDLPGYYHVSKGQTFIDIFELDKTWIEHITYIMNAKKYGVGFNQKGQIFNGIDGEYQCCEENLSTEILRQKINNISFYGKTLKQNSRLDRENINKPISFIKNGIKSGQIIDMHCPRPYEKYKNRIEEILDII